MSAVHQELLVMAERQLALADAGAWDELVEAMDAFQRHAGALPAIPPPGAREALRAAAAIVARVDERLRVARMDCARELSRLQRGRGAVRSYAQGALAPGVQLDGTA